MVMCGCAVALLLGSCIQFTDELDLNNKVSLDMKIGPGGLSIPIGSLSKIYLDSLIKVGDDDSALDTLDGGIYGITMDGSIDKVKVGISDVTINLPQPEIKPLETSFNNYEPDDVEIMAQNSSAKVGNFIDIDGMDSKLPALESNYSTPKKSVTSVKDNSLSIPAIQIAKQTVDCKFNYPLPADVEKLKTVWFGAKKGTRTGQKVSLDVDLGRVYELASNPTITFGQVEIVFPDNFEIEKDNDLSNYLEGGSIQVTNHNKLTIEGSTVKGLSRNLAVLPLSFYVKSADFSNYEKTIDYDNSVSYKMSLSVSGTADVNKTIDFGIDITLKDSLKMSDIDVDIKKQNIQIAEQTVHSDCVLSGLGDVSRLNTVDFVEDNSSILISISDPELDPFSLDGSSNITLTFSDMFVFADACKTLSGESVGYWESGNKLVLDPIKAFGQTLDLHVKSMNVNKDVEADSTITIKNEVKYSGAMVVNSTNGVTYQDIKDLKDKMIDVDVSGFLKVASANVITAVLNTSFGDTISFSINEKVDDALVMVNRIDLTEPAGAMVKLKFSGVPSTIDKAYFDTMCVTFPDFILLGYNGFDSRVTVSGNSLYIIGDLTREELSTDGDGFVIDNANNKGFTIQGLGFTTPQEIKNGYLVMDSCDVFITGNVRINNQSVNSSELKAVSVTPIVKFDPIHVKSFYGKVDPEIKQVHQGLSIDLGDDIDFLKDEENSLNLSDPRITINLRNSITVPILLDLSLSSKDSKGSYIARDITADNSPIRLEACDPKEEVRQTTLIISNHDWTASATSDTVFVRMSRLPELMKTVPDSIMFDLIPRIDQSVEHYVDLSRELSVSGDYMVAVPLSFDSVYIEYSDTIKDLGKDLEDIADKIDAAKLQLAANVESTIPLGVNLSAKALDANKNVINDIIIGSCHVGAGRANGTTSAMKLDITVNKGGLKDIDALVFTAVCESDDSSDGTILKRGQYIHIKDIKLKFPEGLIIDLTETDDDKK